MGWAIVNQSPAVAIGQAVAEDHLSVAMGILFSFYNIGAAIILSLSVNLFHRQAMQHLLSSLALEKISISANQFRLLNQFVSQPDKMQQIIAKLQLQAPNVVDLFKEGFVAGMHTMFLPSIVFGMVCLAFMLKNRLYKSQKKN